MLRKRLSPAGGFGRVGAADQSTARSMSAQMPSPRTGASTITSAGRSGARA